MQVDAASCNQTMEEMSEELCSLRMQIKYQPSVTSNFVSILATKKYSLHAVYCYYRCTLLHIQYTAHTECLQSALLHDDVIHVHTCANLDHPYVHVITTFITHFNVFDQSDCSLLVS